MYRLIMIIYVVTYNYWEIYEAAFTEIRAVFSIRESAEIYVEAAKLDIYFMYKNGLKYLKLK